VTTAQVLKATMVILSLSSGDGNSFGKNTDNECPGINEYQICFSTTFARFNKKSGENQTYSLPIWNTGINT